MSTPTLPPTGLHEVLQLQTQRMRFLSAPPEGPLNFPNSKSAFTTNYERSIKALGKTEKYLYK